MTTHGTTARTTGSRAVAALAAVPLALVLAACGGGDEPAAPTTPAPAVTSDAPTPDAAASPSPTTPEATPEATTPEATTPGATTPAPAAGSAGGVPSYVVDDVDVDTDDGIREVDIDVDVEQVLTEEEVLALVAELQAEYPEEGVYDLNVDCGLPGGDDDVADADWAIGADAQRDPGLAEGEVRVDLEDDARCG